MSYTRTNWVPKEDNGNIPEGAPAINAKNLNNIEDGIEEALGAAKRIDKEYKEYADGNILYFNGWAHFEKNKDVCLFQLPTDIKFSKYIPVVQVGAVGNYKHLFVLPYGETTVVYHESFEGSITITLTEEGQIWYNSPQNSREVEMHIMLIPVSRQTMIANPLMESNQN